nr:hypothetical protein [Nanoarchaeota archaeon]
MRTKFLLENNNYTVTPKNIHQLITEQEPALTLLEIRNDPKGLSMDDHWYVW